MGDHGLLRELLPEFTAELAAALQQDGELDLATQLDTLQVTGRCRCAEADCGSFHVADGSPRPPRGGLVNHIANLEPGQIILDVCYGRITYIEVFDRPDVNTITAGLPRAPTEAPSPTPNGVIIRPPWPDYGPLGNGQGSPHR